MEVFVGGFLTFSLYVLQTRWSEFNSAAVNQRDADEVAPVSGTGTPFPPDWLFLLLLLLILSPPRAAAQLAAGKALHQEQGGSGVCTDLCHGVPNPVAQVLL